MATDAGGKVKTFYLILHVTSERERIAGSKYYSETIISACKCSDLNIDMVGRTDPKRKGENRNYIYLMVVLV
jgi:hypothetical protein